jgi:5-methylcytosine-specific restriction endonuclease McrA
MNSELRCGATPTEKRCSKCGEVKPAGDFSKDSSRRDGLDTRCRACFRAYNEANREKVAARKKAYREANREKEAARKKAYREANWEKEAAQKKAYREANPEKVAAQKKAYHEANREKVAAQQKAYREANPEKVAARHRAYREANPEKVAARNKAYREANREKEAAHKAMLRGKQRAQKFGGQHIDHTTEQFHARMSMFGNKCWICGGPWEHSDHMKPLARRGPHMLANWRPSCRDCNLRKSDMWPTPEQGEGIGQLVKQMVADIRDYKHKTEKYRRSATPCGATVLNKVMHVVTASSPTIDNASHTPKRIAE